MIRFANPTVLKSLAALMVVSLMLSSCGGRYLPPAPVIFGGKWGRTAQKTYAVPRSGKVIVKKGDSVHLIARRYGVSVRELVSLNRLKPPYIVYIGQALRLPAARIHTVRRGDTLYAISRKYGVDVASLTRMNGIKRPYTIYPNQRLVLPGAVKTSTRVVSRPSGSRTPISPKRTSPRQQTQATTAPSKRPTTKPAPKLAKVPTPPPRSTGKFVWPVKGQVISKYGEKGGGLRNDGLNIAAPDGAPIHAAENGVVIYAGNELKGFGNLLLVKHAGGWMTAYAHAGKVAVKRGQKVAKGQVIASVGSSGNVDKPQLHFEVRRKKKAVDPMKYLARA